MADPQALSAARLGTKALRAWLRESGAPLIDLAGADLRGLDLRWMNFSGALLQNADLSNAVLTGSYFGPARFRRTPPFIREKDEPARLDGANLCNTTLLGATFNYATFDGVVLDGAYLGMTNFRGVTFSGTSLREAQFLNTSLVGCDLSNAVAIDSVEHLGPSFVDFSTIQMSKNLPSRFLQQIGLSRDFASGLVGLLKPSSDTPPERSCFLSHSTADKVFCDHLYRRLVDEDVRVWYAPEDMRGGQPISKQLTNALRAHDRVVVVLSETSLRSNWVSNELRWGLIREQESHSQVLFPVSVVSFDRLKDWQLIDSNTGVDIADYLRSFYIPNFEGWTDPDQFEESFRKLMRGLSR